MDEQINSTSSGQTPPKWWQKEFNLRPGHDWHDDRDPPWLFLLCGRAGWRLRAIVLNGPQGSFVDLGSEDVLIPTPLRFQ
jgi:hypothetical protein